MTGAPAHPASRQSTSPPRRGLTFGLMGSVIVALHVVGAMLLIEAVGWGHASHRAFTLGTGLTAYVLGLRHAFDVDHVAAIDNVTRRLSGERERPLCVGLMFALGHSTVVLLAAGLFAAGVRIVGGSTLHALASGVGTGISGAFLCLLGGLNALALAGAVNAFRASERGAADILDAQRRLAGSVVGRGLGRLSGFVRRPRHMFAVGFLFGLGFDTAGEVVLLFLAAGSAGAGLPLYAILCLPILFAAGMSLLDTIDGVLMSFAYGWGESEPTRRAIYGVAVTALSVAVALLVGTLEIVGLLGRATGLHGGPWGWLEAIDPSLLGAVVIATFAIVWALAIGAWRLGRLRGA